MNPNVSSVNTPRSIEILLLDILSLIPKTESEGRVLCQKLNLLQESCKEIRKQDADSLLELSARPLLTMLQYFTLPFLSEAARSSMLEPPCADLIRESLLGVLCTLLERCDHASDSLFSQTLSVFTRLLDLDAPPSKKENAVTVLTSTSLFSERFHENFANSISWLFLRYDPAPSLNGRTVRVAETIPAHSAAVGFLIYRALEFSRIHKSKGIRLCYLNTISNIIQTLADSSLLAELLPGCLSTLAVILTGDYKQGSAIFESSLVILGNIISATMSDSRRCVPDLQWSQPSLESVSGALRRLHAGKDSLSHEDRKFDSVNLKYPSDSWFHNAAPKVERVVSSIFRTALRGFSIEEEQGGAISTASIAYDSPTVRVAAIFAARTICISCTQSLSGILPQLIDYIVSFSSDTFPVVAEASHVAFSDLHSTLSSSSGSFLLETCESNFSRLLNALPRIIRSSDESSKVLRLRAIYGYTVLLRPVLPQALSNVLPRFGESIVDSLEINFRGNWTNSQRSSTQFDEQPMQTMPNSSDYFYLSFLQRRFMHFQEMSTFELIRSIIHECAAHGNLVELVDYFMSVTYPSALSMAEAPPQTILILNELLLGASSSRSTNIDSLPDVVDILYSFYLSDEIWVNVLESSFSSLTSPTRSAHRCLLSALLLEGIGAFAQILGSSVSIKLAQLLYPLLEKLGDDTELVSSAAWRALLRVAFFSGHASVLDLVQKNSDYVVDNIIQNLRYLKLFGPSISVLNGVLRHAGDMVLHILPDIMDEVFRCLDSNSANHTPGFLRVMLSCATLIHQRIRDATLSNSQMASQHTQTLHFGAVDIESCAMILESSCNFDLHRFLSAKLNYRRSCMDVLHCIRQETLETTADQYFRDYHANNSSDVASDMPGDHLDDYDPVLAKDDTVARVRTEFASQLALVERLMQKCQHYTAIAGASNKVMVLDIVDSCIRSLSMDTNKLLPLVNSLWEPLSHRFFDGDLRVSARALQLMQFLSTTCAEFVSRRFSEDFWPNLRGKLRVMNPFSPHYVRGTLEGDELQYSNASLFKFSPSYKYQKTMLECLEACCSSICMTDQIAGEILSATWFYLSSFQIHELRELEKKLLKQLETKHGDLVWYWLAEAGSVLCTSPCRKLSHLVLWGSKSRLAMFDDVKSFSAGSTSSIGKDRRDFHSLDLLVDGDIGPSLREAFVGAPAGCFIVQ